MSKKIEVQKTEVVSIKLRIKGKEIDLTLEDAKELKDALNRVFAEPVTIKEYVPYTPYIPYEPYKPYEPWIQPYWGDGTGNAPPKLPEIWCSPNTTSGTITISDNLNGFGSTTLNLDLSGTQHYGGVTTATICRGDL